MLFQVMLYWQFTVMRVSFELNTLENHLSSAILLINMWVRMHGGADFTVWLSGPWWAVGPANGQEKWAGPSWAHGRKQRYKTHSGNPSWPRCSGPHPGSPPPGRPSASRPATTPGILLNWLPRPRCCHRKQPSPTQCELRCAHQGGRNGHEQDDRSLV